MPLLDKYSTKVGISVRGFTVTFQSLSDFSKNLIESLEDAINKDTNTKQSSSAPTQNSFFPEQNVLEDSVKNSKIIPIKYYINKSCFLYSRSELIKETFITVINKHINFRVN